MPRDDDEGFSPTIAPENNPITGTEATQAPGFQRTITAPPGAPIPTDRPRVAPGPVVSPFPKTITQPPIVIANAETVGADDASRAPSGDTQRGIAPAGGESRPGTSGVRTPSRSTVGNEMRGASIERFTPVAADRFELLDELARGGLGRVFRARDPRTGRIVAIKEVLQPQQEIILRFAREALVTANLQHPSVVPVYEVGRWPSGEPFLAMKLVEGRTLDALIREARTLNDRLALLPHIIDIADALAYAHSEHVIHRDLKPANILVGAYGETVVIDWGLAKNLATGEETDELPLATTIPPDNNETMAGSVLGTPAYMPPEQARGERLDERADVYAIGAILYHVLAGERPFMQAKSIDELIELVATASPRPLAHVPHAPSELIAIADKAMARDPAARYPTAQGLAEDLRKFTAGKLVGAHQYTTWELIKRWVAQHKATVAIAAIAMGVLIVVGTVSAVRITQERDEANHQRRAALAAQDEERIARSLAEQRYRDSLLELARQETIAANPARALTLVTGALAADGAPLTALDVTLTQALGEFSGLVQVIPPMDSAGNIGSFAPDARRVYFASSGSTARAWDTVTRTIVWEKPLAYGVRLSPDGVHLIGANSSSELVLAKAADGSRLAAWSLGASEGANPSWFTWAADSVHFAASGEGGVWFGTIGAGALHHPTGSTSEVWTAQFSPDSKRLASCGKDGRVQIFDSETGALTAAFTDLDDGCWSLAWIDSDRLMAGDKHAVRTWNVVTKRVEQRLAQPYAYQIITGGTPADPWVMTCGDGTVARVWNPTTGALRHELPGHEIACDTAVAYEPWVVTTDEAGHVYVWDPRTGERVAALPKESTIRDVQVERGYLAVFTNERSLLWKLDSDARLRRIPAHAARIRDVLFEGDSAVWTASNDGTVRRTPLAPGQQPLVLGQPIYSEPAFSDPTSEIARQPPNRLSARSVRLTPDRATVVTSYEDGAIRTWDARTGASRTTLRGHTGRVRRTAITSDGHTVFSIGDTTLRKWDLETGKQLAQQDLGAKGYELTLFNDEKMLATLADDKSVQIWSPVDLARVSTKPMKSSLETIPTYRDRLVVSDMSQLLLMNQTGEILATSTMQSAVFAHIIDAGDRHWIGAGATGGALYIVDATTGAALKTFGHPTPQPILAVAFSPSGDLLATMNDLRVWIWDVTTGALLATSQRPSAFPLKLAWSADSTQVAFAGASGTLWVWRVTGRTSPADLGAYTRCVSPWKLHDAVLERAPFDPAACNVLPPFNP